MLRLLGRGRGSQLVFQELGIGRRGTTRSGSCLLERTSGSAVVDTRRFIELNLSDISLGEPLVELETVCKGSARIREMKPNLPRMQAVPGGDASLGI